MELTKEQKQAYLADPETCPLCGCHDLDGGEVQIETGKAWQKVYCLACEQGWRDDYVLTDITLIG